MPTKASRSKKVPHLTLFVHVALRSAVQIAAFMQVGWWRQGVFYPSCAIRSSHTESGRSRVEDRRNLDSVILSGRSYSCDHVARPSRYSTFRVCTTWASCKSRECTTIAVRRREGVTNVNQVSYKSPGVSGGCHSPRSICNANLPIPAGRGVPDCGPQRLDMPLRHIGLVDCRRCTSDKYTACRPGLSVVWRSLV